MPLRVRMCYSKALLSPPRLRSWERGARPCSHTTSHTCTFSLRTHTCGELTRDHVGQTVTLYGWLRKPRVLGSQGVAFLPVHDTTGTTQFVCKLEEWQSVLTSFKAPERVVRVVGAVKERPSEAVNLDAPTGEIEVELESLQVLNEATNHPFATFGRIDSNIAVEQQLRERQLYLRVPHMQDNIRLRSKVSMALREVLVNRHGFVEVETPTLFKRTAEGAQEFIVPTRICGKYFSLAQSPQQFKQLLMVAGFDRYFQFARCYRDEDQRSDRQPEFTQVDLEMSFVDSECVMGLTEDLLHSTITSTCPHLSLLRLPFPRIEYREAMEQYGSDKPDTRYEMTLQNLDSIWQELLQEMGVATEESSASCRHCYGVRVPQWEQAMHDLGNSKAQKSELTTRMKDISCIYPTTMLQSDQSSSESSVQGLLNSNFPAGIFSKSRPSLAEKFTQRVKDRLGWQDGDLCILASSEDGEKEKMLTALGAWRSLAASALHHSNRLELDSTQLNFLWVTGFPLFSVSAEKGGVYHVTSTHHPFTAPVSEHRSLLDGLPSPTELAQVRAQHYDLVVNGVELGGGSIRIHNPDLQEHILTNILKVPTAHFSHLLKGLRSGCPPHGGIALGFDRLMMVLCQATSLRDVIAFPKSFHSRDLLTGAPSELPPQVISRYHLGDRK